MGGWGVGLAKDFMGVAQNRNKKKRNLWMSLPKIPYSGREILAFVWITYHYPFPSPIEIKQFLQHRHNQLINSQRKNNYKQWLMLCKALVHTMGKILFIFVISFAAEILFIEKNWRLYIRVRQKEVGSVIVKAQMIFADLSGFEEADFFLIF